jgi:hypothetical protein
VGFSAPKESGACEVRPYKAHKQISASNKMACGIREYCIGRVNRSTAAGLMHMQEGTQGRPEVQHHHHHHHHHHHENVNQSCTLTIGFWENFEKNRKLK